jgi:autotransporter translocation and assembly factor TamB
MRRIWKILAILIPLLIIIAAGVIALWHEKLATRLVPVLEAQLSQSLGREVRIGRISGNLLRGAVLHDVRVAEGASFKQGTFARVRRLAVRYRLRDILTNPSRAAAAVDRVDVAGIRLRIERNPRGEWNVASFFKPRPPSAARFTGVVNVTGADIEYTDQTPPQSLRGPLKLRFADVSGVVRPGPTQGVVFRFAGGMGPKGVERIRVFASSAGHTMTLAIAVSQLDLARWNSRLAVGGVRLLGGKADIEMTGVLTTGPKNRAFDYVARAQTHGATVRLKQLADALRAVDGTAFITRDTVEVLDATGNVSGARFSASGLVNGFDQPQLDLRIQARRVTIDTAARLLQLTLPREVRASPGEVDLTVRGSLARPIIDGAVRLPQAHVKQVAMTDLTSELAYRDGVLWLHGLRFGVVSGRVNAEAWVNTRGSAFDARFEAHAEGLDLADIVAASGAQPAQTVEATVQADVAGTYGAEGLRAGGSFEARDGRIGDLSFTSARGVAEVAQGGLHITSARFETDAGVAVVEGNVDAQGAIDLQVRASDVNIAAVSRLLGVKSEGVAGTAYLAGTVTGTTRDPIATATLQVIDAEYSQQRFDLLSGTIIASRTAIAADSLLAYQEGARYAVTGSVVGLDRPRDDIAIQGEVQVGYASLADVLELAKVSAAIEGDVEAAVSVGGSIGAPTAGGEVRVHHPVVDGWALDSAEARFDLSDNIVHLREAKVEVGGSTLAASGQVSLDGALQIHFSADLDLADLRPPETMKLPVEIAGKVSAGGDVAGTTQEPQVTAQVRSDRVSVAGEEFTDLAVETSYSSDTGRNQVHAGVKQDGAQFAADGWVDLAARTMQVTAGVSGGKLDQIRAAAQRIGQRFAEGSVMWKVAQLAAAAPSPVSGTIDAQATLGGPWATPAGDVSIRLTGASIAGAAIPDTTAALGVAGRVVEIRDFEAREGPSYATATGTIDLEGPVSVNLDAYNLSAGLLEPWLGAKGIVSGSADVSISVEGTLEKPQVVGSMEVDQLGAGGVKVDHLQVPRFEVRDDALIAERINVAMGPYVIAASATVPVTWKPLGINRAGRWSVAVDMSDQDLALLTRLIPAIAAASGSLDGRVEFSGSLEQPELRGAVTIARGVVRVRGERTQVTGLDATVRFEGKRIVLERLTGLVGGGAFVAQGDVELVTLSPSHLMSNRFNLSVTGNGLEIDAGDAFRGKVNVAFLFTSPQEGEGPPTLGGRVVLSSGQIGIPQRAEMRPMVEQPPFNPRLNIDIVIEPNLRVRTSTISMTVSGAGHVGGRLGSPSATATVESRRGTVDLPGASFRVTYASMEATVSPPRVPAPGMPPVADVRAVIRLDAEARVRGYQVYLSMSGPLTDPNVEPKIDLHSVPDLDQERLWAMVTGLPVGPGAPEFGSQTRALLTTGLGVVALYPLERATARALGLEEFGVEYSQFEPMRLRLGGYVLEKLYATYLRSVAEPIPTWDFTLAYQVLPTLSLGVRINERNEMFWETLTTKRF